MRRCFGEIIFALSQIEYKGKTLVSSHKSRYAEEDVDVHFDKSLSRDFLPIIHDPKGHAEDQQPDGVFYRILKRGKEQAIQYFVHWKKQDCRQEYPLIGELFSHDFDYEPVVAFVTQGKIWKLVLSGGGNILQGGHQTEIYRNDKSVAIGKVTYKTSAKPVYPFGVMKATDSFKENSIDSLRFKGNRPILALATCYHVYTTARQYLKGPKLDVELFEMTDEVITRWYRKENFGHDVSNPFRYPHVRYSPSPKMKQITEERKRLLAQKRPNRNDL